MIHVGISAPLIPFGTQRMHTYSHVSQFNIPLTFLQFVLKHSYQDFITILLPDAAMNTNKKLPMFVNRKTKYKKYKIQKHFSPRSHDITDNVVNQQSLLPTRLKALGLRKITETQLRKSME